MMKADTIRCHRLRFQEPVDRRSKLPNVAPPSYASVPTSDHERRTDTPADRRRRLPVSRGIFGPAAMNPSLDAQVAEWQAKHAEVSDAYLRAKAEAENTRRRAEEEVSKARKFAIDAFAESLLPVKDSLEAAIAIQGGDTEQLLEGVHATLRQLGQALERNKVVQISSTAGHALRSPPASGHQRRARRAGGQYRGRRAPEGIPDRRPCAPPCPGDGERAEVTSSTSRFP